MGLFDSKEVREAKRTYQALLKIKDTSNVLRNLLPKTEKEFLSSNYKESLIETYKCVCEVMKDQEAVKWLNLKNLGICFDLVNRYVNEYRIIENIPRSVMSYVQTQIKSNIIIKQSEANMKQKEIENKNFILELEGGIRQLDSAPGITRLRAVAAEQANEEMLKMKQLEFEQKFPQYKELKAAICRLELGIIKEEQLEQINRIITIGKQKYPEFNFQDMLFPYLYEKKEMGILNNESEKKIYLSASRTAVNRNSQVDNIEFAQAEYLKYCLHLNFSYFDPDGDIVEFAVPFHKTLIFIRLMQELEEFNNKQTMQQNSHESSGPKR